MGGPGFGHDMRGLSAAADYLGLKESDLAAKLQSGKSLADIAKDQGKSVDGLVNALVNDAKTHLDQAVKDGHLTQAQANQILSQIKQHITDFVNGTVPQGFGPSFRGGSGFQGPAGPPRSASSVRRRGGHGPGSQRVASSPERGAGPLPSPASLSARNGRRFARLYCDDKNPENRCSVESGIDA